MGIGLLSDKAVINLKSVLHRKDSIRVSFQPVFCKQTLEGNVTLGT